MEQKPIRPLLLIVNPVAGRRTGKKHLSELISAFNRRGFLTTVYITQARGDAETFVAARGGDFERVVCVGGDGTLNETVAGIMKCGVSVPLGYIPAGSTNVFADSHGLSESPARAARDAASDNVRSFDIGHFNDRSFAYVAAFGVFTCLSFTTPQRLKNRLGHTAYILDGIRDIAQIRPAHVTLEADGELHEGDYLFGAVCNASTLGRAFELPKGSVDMADGRFEVILIQTPSTLLRLQDTVAALRTQDYAACPDIDYFHASHIRIRCENTLEWTLDGEPAADCGEIEIQCLPRALKLICP